MCAAGVDEVGDNNGRISRAFIKFDVSAIEGKTIDHAQLFVENRTSETCANRATTIRRVTQPWNQATVNYPGPSHTSTVYGQSGISLGGRPVRRVNCGMTLPSWCGSGLMARTPTMGWRSGRVRLIRPRIR